MLIKVVCGVVYKLLMLCDCASARRGMNATLYCTCPSSQYLWLCVVQSCSSI